MQTTLLIDGDILLFRWACAAEEAVDWGDGVWTLTANLDEAAASLDNNITRLRAEFAAKNVVVALTGHKNFRRSLDAGYKQNRADKRPPLILKPLREHLCANYTIIQHPLIEADDAIGIAATKPGRYANNQIIVSDDKDLRQIPGLHCGLRSGSFELTTVTAEEARRWHLVQALAGDQTDNYPGCPGLGVKRASKLIDEAPEWETVVAAYARAGLEEADALHQARLAKILDHNLWDNINKRPILWTPPTPTTSPR